MDRINTSSTPETNVDWYADGERANAVVLNRPIKAVSEIINTGLIDPIMNGPDVKPVMNIDFSNTKSSDSRITVVRSGTSTYINQFGQITLASTDSPRITHDPVTLRCTGLMKEGARTNLLLNSLINGTNLSTKSVTVTAQAYTLSFYGTGTVTLSGASTGSLVGSGAYPTRSTMTFTPSAGSLTLTVTGTVQFAQLEAGTGASSFIPTAGASATRSADSIFIDGTRFNAFHNGTEGTYLVKGSVSVTSTSAAARRIISVSDAAGTDEISIRHSTGAAANRIYAYVNDSGTAQVDTSGSTLDISTSTPFIAVLGYKSGSFDFGCAGTVISDNSGSVPTVDRIRFGSSVSGDDMFGTFEKIAFYPKKLQTSAIQVLSVL